MEKKILITTPAGNVGMATLCELARHSNRQNLKIAAGVRLTNQTSPDKTLNEAVTWTDTRVPLDFARPDTLNTFLKLAGYEALTCTKVATILTSHRKIRTQHNISCVGNE